MTAQVTIRSVGAGGDGVANLTGDQIYVPFTLPGEVANVARVGNRADVMALLQTSNERQDAECRHFEDCGGCSLQHWQDEPYRLWKRELLVSALKGRGLDVDVDALVACEPRSRRRAVFAVRRTEKGVLLGFNRHQSHEIIDIVECAVTVPEIIARLDDLRAIGALIAPGSKPFKLAATVTESGLDLAASGCGELSDEQRRAVTALVMKQGFARLAHEGEIVVEPKKPVIHFGRVSVPVPPGCFLQATEAAEEVMVSLVLAHLGKAKRVADLFCGVGTFALTIAEKSAVHAIESDAPALAALDRGVRHVQGLKPVSIERRDLFRRPLMPKELLPYNAVVFDPPRAGAEEQAKELAKSKVEKLVAVSCNPVTLARDLAILVAGGYRINRVTPIDQFLWSPHVEAVVSLTKK
ncbi:class I SAM-dependent RNA methyltransferase [Brucella sp. BE17]|uniref:class I SAM-dependent RNA methyltransferase n=1 Tax=Brucella sp. BE17 TaxID=3142977 RepID=UPI0031BA9505